MRHLAFFTTAVLMSATVATQAYAATGNDLHEWCKEEPPLMSLAYVNGVYDMSGFMGKDVICLPAGLTVGQVNDVVCKWLDDNPKERHFPSVKAVLFAFADAWPCQQ